MCPHLRSWIPAARRILVSASTSRRKPCLPPHSVIAKWLANSTSWSMRCRTKLRVGCPTIVSSVTAYILPLIISVMVVTVAMIAVMIRGRM